MTRKFELVNSPKWAKAYLKLRREQNLETDQGKLGSYIADVVQGWPVDKWRPISFAILPVWIANLFFGRSTLGQIKPFEIDDKILDPFVEIQKIFNGDFSLRNRKQTKDRDEVEQRLLSDINPSAFEHLMVALLQLERPRENWRHVGGSGDGGVDGIAGNAKGKLVGLLQCKWKFDDDKLDFFKENKQTAGINKFLATLSHAKNLNVPKHIIFWDRSKIANLVLRHADSLPWAISMKITQRNYMRADQVRPWRSG